MCSFHIGTGHRQKVKAAYESKTSENPSDFGRKTRSKIIDSTKAINWRACDLWSLIHDNIQKTDSLEDSSECHMSIYGGLVKL